jgi:RsiW-degrading membrane proteinase PrsW (M82 family)
MSEVIHPHHRHGWWWKTLLSGLGLWILTIAITVLTSNANLIPTLILVGSFLVPFCVVLFVIERVTGSISTLQLVLLFFVGGIFGVLGASVLEVNLQTSIWTFIGVGFIEEFVKGVILVIGGRHVTPRTPVQGALLGATVGAGFAAFESAGYAFNAAISAQGINLVSLVQTEVLRAILAPVGHILWTAILGAVIFGAARWSSRIRWVLGVIVAFVGVSLLHGLWDSLNFLSSILALVFTGNIMVVLERGFLPASTAATVTALATVLYIIGLAIAAVIGLFALWMVLRRARARAGVGTPQHSG